MESTRPGPGSTRYGRPSVASSIRPYRPFPTRAMSRRIRPYRTSEVGVNGSDERRRCGLIGPLPRRRAGTALAVIGAPPSGAGPPNVGPVLQARRFVMRSPPDENEAQRAIASLIETYRQGF